MPHTTPIAVLVSGGGTNLQAIIDASESGQIAARVVCIISNRADAFALQRAQRHGIPGIHLDHRQYLSREDYDAALVSVLRDHGVELVVLAGFMRIVTPILLDAYPMRVMNIHPSLLPSFPGLHPQRRAIEHGVKLSGCTVHFVDEGTDTGPIILQAAVPVLDDDSEETLSARILAQEHRIYPQAIQLYTTGSILVTGRVVKLRPASPSIIDSPDSLPT